MHENFENDIDSKLRSMLENAEVKPSPRVWKGIASRLDAAPSGSKRGALVWGLSLAGVAAALAAVLLILPTDHSNLIYKSAGTVALESDPESAVLPAANTDFVRSEAPATDELFAPAEEPVGTPEAVSAKQAVHSEQEEPVQQAVLSEQKAPVQQQEAPVQQTASAQQKDASAEQAAPARQAAKAGSHVSNVLNPLADMGEEPAQDNIDPLSFSAKGALGQNIGTGELVNRPMRAQGIHEDVGPKTGVYESGSSTYGFPLTFGIGLNIPLSRKLSIGTGVDYSLLTRSFSGVYTEVDALGTTKVEGDIFHKMHYVGIPLDLNYSIYRNKIFNVYAFVGGEIEYCFSNSYTVRGGISNIVYTEPVQGFQFSTELGAGIEASLSKHVGLFFAPSAHYYFLGKQPKSIRTEKQLMVGASLGVKFDL